MDSNTVISNCTSPLEAIKSPFSITLLLSSVSVLIVLGFTTQRRRLWKDGFKSLWGHPGIVTPLNLLSHHYQPDYIYLAILGGISGDILKYIFSADTANFLFSGHSNFIPTTQNIYMNIVITSVISPLLLTLYLSVKYFPLFACVDAPVKVIGHLLGTFYAMFLVSYGIYEDVVVVYCKQKEFAYNFMYGDNTLLWISVSARVPVYIVHLIIFIWYCCMLIMDGVKLCKGGIKEVVYKRQNSNYKYYCDYVKTLLTRKPIVLHGKLYLLVSEALGYVLPCKSSVRKLPLWFLGAIVIALMVLYQFSFLLVSNIIRAVDGISKIIRANCVHGFSPNCPLNVNCCSATAIEFYKGTAVATVAGPLVSFFMCILLIVHMICSVRKSVQNAARGDYQFSKVSPSFRVSSSLKYAGYQIAFILAGYVIYTLVCLLVGLIVVGFYFLFKLYPDIAKYLLSYLMIPLVWVAIAFLGQVILCKLLFVRKGGGKFLIITNQRIFHWFSYILLIYNAILGLVMAVIRVLVTSFFSLLLIFRLDRVTLMKGFEPLDFGHNAFLGVLFLDYTYNNAVVHVFVKLLCEAAVKRRKESTALLSFRNVQNDDVIDPDLAFGVGQSPLINDDKVTLYGSGVDYKESNKSHSWRTSHQAAKRWMVAYTLLRNPSLQPMTANNLNNGNGAC